MGIEQKDKLKAQSWCLNNGIIIYIKMINKNTMIICIKRDGIEKLGNVKYHHKKDKDICADKIWELYTFFYEKNKTN